jgi:soluble lytic murein transglycosylase-like protein
VRRRKQPRNLLSFTPVLLVPLLLGSAPPASPGRSGLTTPLPGHSDRASLAYAEAAAAMRRKDCGAAWKALAPVAAAKGKEGDFALLLGGFYANQCQQIALAEERLFAAGDPHGPLEDWRLFALSQAALARGHVLLGQTSLARLLGDYPGSVLRPRALLEAARIARDRGDDRRALDFVEQARREELRGPEATELEVLAWETGVRLGDLAIQREAARSLLTGSPLRAAELKVVEILRSPDGGINWSGILTAAQLARRAQALLDARLDANALAALDAVDVLDRGVDWYLLKAEALTRSQRGMEALTLLATQTAPDLRHAAALEWARAAAAEEAGTARRGRNLTTAERRELQLRAQQHLEKVVQTGGDPELSKKALKSLYADLMTDGLFDRAVEALRKLRRLDPADTTGANNLWQVGWQEYGRGNYTGAVGTWTELYSLYPNDSAGRRGRYWTGRAFEVLGEMERAQQIYREVAQADTTDLYRKHALARLKGAPLPPAASEQLPDPWPADPALDRVRMLTDLGLDSLAASELALVRGKAQPQTLKATEALILAQQGERRKSMIVIREAFPALGGPFQATLPLVARRIYYPLDYQEPIRTWASTNRLPVHLVYGIIRQESAFDPNAQSWAGARGLMQLMPATARELATKAGLPYSHDKLSDPYYNVRLGTTYFRQVYSMFDENLELSLAGYNGGPYRIKRLWNEAGNRELDRFLEGLNIEESKTYVKRILVLSDSYRQLYPQAG